MKKIRFKTRKLTSYCVFTLLALAPGTLTKAETCQLSCSSSTEKVEGTVNGAAGTYDLIIQQNFGNQNHAYHLVGLYGSFEKRPVAHYVGGPNPSAWFTHFPDGSTLQTREFQAYIWDKIFPATYSFKFTRIDAQGSFCAEGSQVPVYFGSAFNDPEASGSTYSEETGECSFKKLRLNSEK